MAKSNKLTPIADEKQSASAKSKDGLLEVRLFNRGRLEIESPATVSIQIERIDPNYKFPIPEGAVYRIMTYISRPREKILLQGAIYINTEGEYLLPDGENLNKRANINTKGEYLLPDGGNLAIKG